MYSSGVSHISVVIDNEKHQVGSRIHKSYLKSRYRKWCQLLITSANESAQYPQRSRRHALSKLPLLAGQGVPDSAWLA
jgi:hypothetical protein